MANAVRHRRAARAKPDAARRRGASRSRAASSKLPSPQRAWLRQCSSSHPPRQAAPRKALQPVLAPMATSSARGAVVVVVAAVADVVAKARQRAAWAATTRVLPRTTPLALMGSSTSGPPRIPGTSGRRMSRAPRTTRLRLRHLRGSAGCRTPPPPPPPPPERPAVMWSSSASSGSSDASADRSQRDE